MTECHRQAGWQEAYIDQNYRVAWIPGVQLVSGLVHVGRGLYELIFDQFYPANASSHREAADLAGRVKPLYEGTERIVRGICLIFAGLFLYPFGFGLATTYGVNSLDRRRASTVESLARPPEERSQAGLPVEQHPTTSSSLEPVGATPGPTSRVGSLPPGAKSTYTKQDFNTTMEGIFARTKMPNQSVGIWWFFGVTDLDLPSIEGQTDYSAQWKVFLNPRPEHFATTLERSLRAFQNKRVTICGKICNSPEVCRKSKNSCLEDPCEPKMLFYFVGVDQFIKAIECLSEAFPDADEIGFDVGKRARGHQEVEQWGPSFTNQYNRLVYYTQGGFTESGRDRCVNGKSEEKGQQCLAERFHGANYHLYLGTPEPIQTAWSHSASQKGQKGADSDLASSSLLPQTTRSLLSVHLMPSKQDKGVAPAPERAPEDPLKEEKRHLLLHYLEREAELESLVSQVAVSPSDRTLQRRLDKRKRSSLSYLEKQVAMNKRLRQVSRSRWYIEEYKVQPLPHVSMEELAEELGVSERELKVWTVGHVYAKKAIERRKELQELLQRKKACLPVELSQQLDNSVDKVPLRVLLDAFASLEGDYFAEAEGEFLYPLQEECDKAAWEELERRYALDAEEAVQALSRTWQCDTGKKIDPEATADMILSLIHREGFDKNKAEVQRLAERFSLDPHTFIRKPQLNVKEELQALLLGERQSALDKQELARYGLMTSQEIEAQIPTLHSLISRILLSPSSFASPAMALELQHLINQWEAIESLQECRKEAIEALNRVVRAFSSKGLQALEQLLYTLKGAQCLQEAMKRACYGAISIDHLDYDDKQIDSLDGLAYHIPDLTYSSNKGTIEEKECFLIRKLDEIHSQIETKLAFLQRPVPSTFGKVVAKILPTREERIDVKDLYEVIGLCGPVMEKCIEATCDVRRIDPQRLGDGFSWDCSLTKGIELLQAVQKIVAECRKLQENRLKQLQATSATPLFFAEAVHSTTSLEMALSILSSEITAGMASEWGAFVSQQLEIPRYGVVGVGLPQHKLLGSPVVSFLDCNATAKLSRGIRCWLGLEDNIGINGALRDVRSHFNETMAVALNQCLALGGYSAEESLAISQPLLLLITKATQFRCLTKEGEGDVYQLYTKPVRNLFHQTKSVASAEQFNELILRLLDQLDLLVPRAPLEDADGATRLDLLKNCLTNDHRLYRAFLDEQIAAETLPWQPSLSRLLLPSPSMPKKKIEGVLIAPDDDPFLFSVIQQFFQTEKKRKQFDDKKIQTVSQVKKTLDQLGYQVDDLTVIPYFVHSIEQYLLAQRQILVPLPPQLRKARALVKEPA